MDDKVEEILTIWYTLTTPIKVKLLEQLEAGRLVARIRQRGIEGALAAGIEDALDDSHWSTDDLLQQFRSYQRRGQEGV